MDTSRLSVSRLELASSLGLATSPLVLDVRKALRFAESSTLIATARYCNPEALQSLIDTAAPREVVVYCVYGHEVSQGAARQLREAGWSARYLEGGIEGGEPGVDSPADLDRWRSQPLPSIRKRPEFGVSGQEASHWITRSRPKVDRIACPWLIRRFIDTEAHIHYATETSVLANAKSLNATPFDVEGVELSHEWERCTFDAILRAFELQDPALGRMATIIRGADTSRLNIASESGGLLAISLGMSRLHEDDHTMLDAMLPVYDALYAWCRDPGEAHSWQAHTSAGGTQ